MSDFLESEKHYKVWPRQKIKKSAFTPLRRGFVTYLTAVSCMTVRAEDDPNKDHCILIVPVRMQDEKIKQSADKYGFVFEPYTLPEGSDT